MSFSKAQGKKQETSGQKNQNRNNSQKKYNNNSNSNNNNNSNISPRNHASSHSHNDTIIQNPATVKLMHDRMTFLLANLIGTLVEVTVKDGTKFRGIFHGCSTEGELAVALKSAQKMDDDKTFINTLLIFHKDLVEVNAANVDFNETTANDRNTFKTDTDISGKLDIKERELHKWAPAEDESNALGLLDGDLDTSNGEAWDQFAANEKLFGLKTDFNEELYTTHLNRSAPGFKDREKRALKLANEIQKSTTNNVHMMEERGITVDDSGMDEEDLYGAVVRDVNPNRYVPPALRKTQTQQAKKETKSPLNKLITSDLPKASSANPSPIANLPTTRRDFSTAEKNSTEKKSVNESPKRIETEIVTTFKHFAMMEKDKLQAKRNHLQKKEKDGRLAELKAFHQNFKLNVPIPADLVPLLSKGKKPAATTTTTEKSTPSPPPKPSPPAPSNLVKSPKKTTTATNTATTANSTTTTSSSFKFNVKASSFKPNPSAAAFVPGENNTNNHNSGEPHHHNHFFGSRQLKKGGGPSEPLTMLEAFTPSFSDQEASSVGPTWPFGNKSYRVQFSQFAGYDEDVYTGYPSPNYGYGYPAYRYPQYGMPQMAVQQGPYMSPQFVQNVPITAPMPTAGPPAVAYSPQMANVSPHGSPFPQGFPSPQRSPMGPPGMAPQIYQYQGGPMMMRYPPEVMMQRPVMVESMQYSPHQQHENSDSGTETPPN